MKLAVLVLPLILYGCGTPTATTPGAPTPYVIQHPGAVNQADDQIYGALLIARASLASATSLVPMYPALGPILNAKVIPPFNALESAYLSYHAALLAGQAADSTPLQTQIVAITAALASALQSVGASK